MQTRSQTQMEEGQAPMLRNSNVTSLPEPPVVARVSRNEERLQRRVEELEAQLRNSSQHSLQKDLLYLRFIGMVSRGIFNIFS